MGAGIYYAPADGGPAMEIQAGLRVPSYGFDFPDAWDSSTMSVPNYIPGSQIVVVPKSTVFVFTGGTSLIPDIATLDSVTVTGGSVRQNIFWNGTARGNKTFPASVHQILPASSGRGLLVANSTDFTAISDASMVGFCVWRGRVTISNSWSTPETGINRSRYTVFARWNAPGVTLEFDGYTVYASTDNGGDFDQPATVTVDIAIFASGVAPTPGPGINIINAAGQCVFSLTKRPFVYDGFSFVPQWSGTDIGNRMVNLGRYGEYRNVYGGRAFVKYVGLSMSGNIVTATRGRAAYFWDGKYPLNGQRLTQLNIPCIAYMY